MPVTVCVYGPPQGARRHRSTRMGRQYHSAEHREAEASVADVLRDEWRGREPLRGPVGVVITTYHARPKRLQRRQDRGREEYYTGKPDADNIAKLVLDAATKAGIWLDDTQVAVLTVIRWYATLDSEGAMDRPRTEIVIGEVSNA